MPDVDQPVYVLRPDDLALLKLYAGRMIDRADAAALLRENRESVDFAYLEKWGMRKNLESDFAECWRDAFPDEAPPTA